MRVQLAVLAIALTAACSASHPAPKPTPVVVRARSFAGVLTAFGSCAQLTASLRAQALKEVTAYGLPQQYQGYGFDDRALRGALLGAQSDSVAKAAVSVSATNNQEVGVDEPDQVKAHGHVMVVATVGSSRLKVIDVSGEKPSQAGDLLLHLTDAKLLLEGHTVAAIGQVFRQTGYVTVVEIVDITDPSNPAAVRRFRLDGSLLDARFVHGRIVVAVSSTPHLTFGHTLIANRAVIRSATAEQLLPSVSVTPGGATFPAGCTSTLHAAKDTGLQRTSLITLDPSSDQPTQHLTVLGSSTTVYASETSLYLATTPRRYFGGIASRTANQTAVHGFDLSDPDHLQYLGSGTVPGSIIDQYSLSEDKGFLRVATSVGTGSTTDNRITVLKPAAGALVKVGQVGGLGIGQQLYAVRFLGPTAYVVTFRQVDPLYVVDLSDPTRPAARGQLELTGYSTALYPLGSDQLLGIGHGVGTTNEPTGVQAEVFGTRTAATPNLLAKLPLGVGTSLADSDHHALLWWPATRDVVLPAGNGYGANAAEVLHVAQDGRITRAGSIPSHDERPINRAVVVGDLLYSVSDSGIVTAPLERLTDQAWLPFH